MTIACKILVLNRKNLKMLQNHKIIKKNKEYDFEIKNYQKNAKMYKINYLLLI